MTLDYLRAAYLNTGHFSKITCCSCGIEYKAPTGLVRVRQADQNAIYCPLGHSAAWPAGRSRDDYNREMIEWLERQVANRDEDLRSERASHSATKGQLTKVKKRAANGVCPCCNRSFVNVARHVKTQHPEFPPQ